MSIGHHLLDYCSTNTHCGICFQQAYKRVINPTDGNMGFQIGMLRIAFDKVAAECSKQPRAEWISKWDETDVNTELNFKLKYKFYGFYEVKRVHLTGDACYDAYAKGSVDANAEEDKLNIVLGVLLDFVHKPHIPKNQVHGFQRKNGVMDVVAHYPEVISFLHDKKGVIQCKIDVLFADHKKKEEQYAKTITSSKSQQPRVQHFKVLGDINMKRHHANEALSEIDMLIYELGEISKWVATNPNKVLVHNKVQETSDLAIVTTCKCSRHWRLEAQKVLPVISESSLHGFALCIGRFATRANSSKQWQREKIHEVRALSIMKFVSP